MLEHFALVVFKDRLCILDETISSSLILPFLHLLVCFTRFLLSLSLFLSHQALNIQHLPLSLMCARASLVLCRCLCVRVCAHWFFCACSSIKIFISLSEKTSLHPLDAHTSGHSPRRRLDFSWQNKDSHRQRASSRQSHRVISSHHPPCCLPPPLPTTLSL